MLTYNDNISERGGLPEQQYDIYCPLMDLYRELYSQQSEQFPNYLSSSCRTRQHMGGCPKTCSNNEYQPPPIEEKKKDRQCRYVDPETGTRCQNKRNYADYCVSHHSWLVLGKEKQDVRVCSSCGGRAIGNDMCFQCRRKRTREKAAPFPCVDCETLEGEKIKGRCRPCYDKYRRISKN